MSDEAKEVPRLRGWHQEWRVAHRGREGVPFSAEHRAAHCSTTLSALFSGFGTLLGASTDAQWLGRLGGSADGVAAAPKIRAAAAPSDESAAAVRLLLSTGSLKKEFKKVLKIRLVVKTKTL